MQLSGKLVVSSILFIAVLAAGASWWFRYNATNRAAEFWGPLASRLIRDAPIIELYRFEPSHRNSQEFDQLVQFLDAPTNGRDISTMQGLTHLRNALLEDRSYEWPPDPRQPNDEWRWVLVFRDKPGQPTAALAFSRDWKLVTHCQNARGQVLSCEPISRGLNTMFRDPARKNGTAR